LVVAEVQEQLVGPKRLGLKQVKTGGRTYNVRRVRGDSPIRFDLIEDGAVQPTMSVVGRHYQGHDGSTLYLSPAGFASPSEEVGPTIAS
jgi:hypothetical protein